MDGWSDQFQMEKWLDAFAACGIDPKWYAYRRREQDELLPWDFIDSGVTKEFLWREYQKARKEETTKDCRLGCNGCGLHRSKGVCTYADRCSV